jgi:hypothetical protein
LSLMKKYLALICLVLLEDKKVPFRDKLIIDIVS